MCVQKNWVWNDYVIGIIIHRSTNNFLLIYLSAKHYKRRK